MERKKENAINQKRVEWVDILKGAMIFCVLLSHDYPPLLYRQVYAPFFLTTFFFASGYTFSARRGGRNFVFGKLRTLVLPLFLLGTIRVLVTQMIEGGIFWLRMRNLLLQISCKGDEMWFLACIFISSLLTYGTVQLGRRWEDQNRKRIVAMTLIAVFLLGVGFFLILTVKVKLPWLLELSCVMAFYQILGYLYRNVWEKQLGRYQGRKWNIAILGCVLIYLLLALRTENDMDIHAERFPHPTLFLGLSLLAFFFLIPLAKLLERCPAKRLLLFLGENTLFYYAFGGFVRIVLYPLAERAGLFQEYVFCFVCAGMTAVVMILPARLVNRYVPWLVGKKEIKS